MALIVQQLTSGQSNANYAQSNDLAGQLAAAILTTSVATLLSDNNPAATTRRIIKIQMGTSSHSLVICGWDYNNVSIDIDKEAGYYPYFGYQNYQTGLIQLQSYQGSTYRTISLLNKNIKILWNINFLLLAIPGMSTLAWFKNTDNSWLVHCGALYGNGSDSTGVGMNLTYCGATYGGYDTQGNYYPLKTKWIIGSQIQPYEAFNIFTIYSGGLVSGSFYTDSNGKNWYYDGSYIYTDTF